jgi:hypothetical protein
MPKALQRIGQLTAGNWLISLVDLQRINQFTAGKLVDFTG